MTAASRQLKVGDRVTTDFDKKHSGTTDIEHVIVARREGCRSQSGVNFRVDPPLRGADGWIDADWFKPVDEERTE